VRRILLLVSLAISLAVFMAPAVAQTILVTAVNYGANVIVAESSGTGAPSGGCTGFNRYIQTSGANTASLWQCLGGAWYQQGAIGSGGTVTSFSAPSVSWPAWLVPTVATASSTPSLTVAASAIPNSALANTGTTVNSQSCVLGSSCTIPFQTNGSGNTSQAGINLLTSTTNAVGLTVTPVNSATNGEKFEITGGSYTGSAAGYSGSAHGLAAPLLCNGASDTSTAMACTTSPSFTPAVGDTILFYPDVASGASPTLSVNGSTAVSISPTLAANQMFGATYELLTYRNVLGTYTWYIVDGGIIQYPSGGGTGAFGSLSGIPYANGFSAWTNATAAQLGTLFASYISTVTGCGSAGYFYVPGSAACRILASGDIPANAANTSGTAANLSGTPALPNGTTATTQTAGDTTADLATDAFTTLSGVTAPAYTTCSASCAVNLATGRTQIVLLTGSPSAMTFTNASAGLYTFVIVQNATGGYTFTWPTGTRGGGTISSAAGTATASTVATQSFVYIPSGAITTAALVAQGAMTFGN